MPPKPANGKATEGASRPQAPRSNPSSLQPAQPSASRPNGQDDGTGASAGGEETKKKRRRGGRRHNKNRRESFAPPSEADSTQGTLTERPNLETVTEGQPQSTSFYKLGNRADSDSSLESHVLLDHREQNHNPARARRQSTATSGPRRSQAQGALAQQLHPGQVQEQSNYGFPRVSSVVDGPSDEEDNNDRTPLMSHHRPSRVHSGYGGLSSSQGDGRRDRRRQSTASSASARRKSTLPRPRSIQSSEDDYDVNNPPSRPDSPRLGGDETFDDVMLPEYGGSPVENRRPGSNRGGDHVINIDNFGHKIPQSPGGVGLRRRGTGTSPVEDVCLPFEQMTEIGEEEEDYMHQTQSQERPRKRHRKEWPDLQVLEEWSREEKEERTMEGVRAKKVDEPVLVGGRLRPQRGTWRREDEEAPFRWTYFNEEMETSLRSHSLSGLQQLGNSFREMFIPEPPELDDSSSDESESDVAPDRSATPVNGRSSRAGTRQSSILDHNGFHPKTGSGDGTPTKGQSTERGGRRKRFGPRPIFWLDVLQPTWEEMKVLSRAFGIHKLTAEDIMEQEAREKVELFRNYYFVNYRTFEQDRESEDYLDPVNMYFIVFKGGVISFHFSQLPHPPNVRRRIRQLAEHQYTDSDWIAYAIIDNITDAYAPLIEQIEEEVDDIDDDILKLHQHQPIDEKNSKGSGGKQKSISDPPGVRGQGHDEQATPADAKRDMLVRVGECRKRVMSLYRLLGNKADVIKGLAKRCNEQWQVAPRSDVGLYLGDIQDHIITMTGNLTHYESILSRAHSNYLAQINIGMNERAEQTNDVLGRLTVLGTIVLPMNIVTGMWGMNCLVPGQVEDNPTLVWFFGLTAFLILFGLTSFFVAKRVYGL